jgi:hypothetical protein
MKLVKGLVFSLTAFVLVVISGCSSGTYLNQNTSTLMNEDASQYALSIDDFEAGWIRSGASSLTVEDTKSAYHVAFYEDTLMGTKLDNTVWVYSTIEAAQKAYLSLKPTNVSVSSVSYGDEGFKKLDSFILGEADLVFREKNVVVDIHVTFSTDAETYARKVAKKIR